MFAHTGTCQSEAAHCRGLNRLQRAAPVTHADLVFQIVRLTAFGEVRSSGGEAAGRHDWIDPASEEPDRQSQLGPTQSFVVADLRRCEPRFCKLRDEGRQLVQASIIGAPSLGIEAVMVSVTCGSPRLGAVNKAG